MAVSNRESALNETPDRICLKRHFPVTLSPSQKKCNLKNPNPPCHLQSETSDLEWVPESFYCAPRNGNRCSPGAFTLSICETEDPFLISFLSLRLNVALPRCIFSCLVLVNCFDIFPSELFMLVSATLPVP